MFTELFKSNSLQKSDLFYKCAVTFLGVFLALILNNYVAHRNEKSRFLTNLHAWKYELTGNLALLSHIRERTSEKNFFYGKLSTTVVEALINDRATYQFGKRALHEIAVATVTRTKSFNMLYERFETIAVIQRRLDGPTVEIIRNKIDQTRFIYEIALKLIDEGYLQNKKGLSKESIYWKVEQALDVEKKAGYKKYEFIKDNGSKPPKQDQSA